MDPDILYVDGFEPDHQSLFARLRTEVVWDERLRTRMTASFGVPYDYSGLTYAAVAMPPTLANVRDRLAARLGWTANNCLLNLYADGRSTMGFHGDETEQLEADTGIAIVSLGAERTIRFHPVGDKTRMVERLLLGGSLLAMSLAMQSSWRHGIQREPTHEGRISLTFRRVVSGSTSREV